jgi:hypothetical protein
LTHPIEPEKSIAFSAFVDTGAGALILLSAWKSRLGKFINEEQVELVWANKVVAWRIWRLTFPSRETPKMSDEVILELSEWSALFSSRN